MGRVYIDQDICTGDGLCQEIAPQVFYGCDDGLWYVRDYGDPDVPSDSKNAKLKGVSGLASYPDDYAEAIMEAAEECPGSCIFVEQEDGSFYSN